MMMCAPTLRTRNIPISYDYSDFLGSKCEWSSQLTNHIAEGSSALYGGLAQQDPHEPRGIMARLRRLAKEDDSVCYLGQYDNDHVCEVAFRLFLIVAHQSQNWKSHERWTAAQIWKQMPQVNVFSSTVGTGGMFLERPMPT